MWWESKISWWSLFLVNQILLNNVWRYDSIWYTIIYSRLRIYGIYSLQFFIWISSLSWPLFQEIMSEYLHSVVAKKSMYSQNKMHWLQSSVAVWYERKWVFFMMITMVVNTGSTKPRNSRQLIVHEKLSAVFWD